MFFVILINNFIECCYPRQQVQIAVTRADFTWTSVMRHYNSIPMTFLLSAPKDTFTLILFIIPKISASFVIFLTVLLIVADVWGVLSSCMDCPISAYWYLTPPLSSVIVHQYAMQWIRFRHIQLVLMSAQLWQRSSPTDTVCTKIQSCCLFSTFLFQRGLT